MSSPNIAVIELAGAQHIVIAGEKLEINKLNGYEPEKEKKIKPLLSTKNGEVMFNDGNVVAKLVENKKGKKMYIVKFNAKDRYRKRQGHRQHLSVLEIISVNGQSKEDVKKFKKTEDEVK